MQDREASEASGGQDRFEALLREQARMADELAAVAPSGLAEHHEREADVLRDGADNFRTRMTTEQRESLDRMSGGGMRALATLGRWMAGWIKRGDA